MVGELRELPQVEPGDEPLLVQIDERLSGDLPVRLPRPALDPQPGPLLLSELVRLGPASAPGPEEILREVRVELWREVKLYS